MKSILLLCLLITVNYVHSQSDQLDDEIKAEQLDQIKLDDISEAEYAKLREKAEKFEFQAEVDRMMKMIINSMYKNKDIFLRELISNASDALDKIRVLALTAPKLLEYLSEFSIRIRADKENNLLHIVDTGVGMTKEELISNLGTIAKSGTAEFLKKNAENPDLSATQLNDLIGQFGVGFYSAFLAADRVVVTSKSYQSNASQYIWESDSKSYTINEDPRGNTLKRGTQITLHLKDEAKDFLNEDNLKSLIIKYSQFINFPIYLWNKKTETVEESIEDDVASTEEEKKDDEANIEEVKDEKPKTKKVEKIVWDYELVNVAKPIWTRKSEDINDEEYNLFYKSITKDTQDPLAKIHFTAEGEVTFKALLFVPTANPSESFNKYGTRTDSIRMYVRRVFITDNFEDMLPNYLNFIRGVIDSDDLPLNVSRETLQQHKLLKIIKKKLVRKVLDMFKKISDEDYDKFWSEFSTNIKLGIIEDSYNRNRLAKLLRYHSSHTGPNAQTSLTDYKERMKPDQEFIYYLAGTSFEEVSKSPFVEGLQKKGYEILYLTDAVDEYTISSLTDFEDKKFQNIAKDGLRLKENEDNKERTEQLKKDFEPLMTWLEKTALVNKIQKVTISQRLHSSPCALVASQFGWTGNMERLAKSNAHSKSKDMSRDFYLSQKKLFEINPKHPVIKELLRIVVADADDEQAFNIANLLFETATLRSGYTLDNTADYAVRVESLLRKSLGISQNEPIEEDEFDAVQDDKKEEVVDESHDEL